MEGNVSFELENKTYPSLNWSLRILLVSKMLWYINAPIPISWTWPHFSPSNDSLNRPSQI